MAAAAMDKSIAGLLDARSSGLPATRELLRQRILYGGSWRDRADDIARLDEDELRRVEARAGALNHRLIRHAGAASELAGRLDELLQDAAEKEAGKAEQHYLQRAQLIAAGAAPTTVLDWVKVRAGELSRVELRDLRPRTALPSLSTRPEYQPIADSVRATRERAQQHPVK